VHFSEKSDAKMKSQIATLHPTGREAVQDQLRAVMVRTLAQ
jgi:hypothetical protein